VDSLPYPQGEGGPCSHPRVRGRARLPLLLAHLARPLSLSGSAPRASVSRCREATPDPLVSTSEVGPYVDVVHRRGRRTSADQQAIQFRPFPRLNVSGSCAYSVDDPVGGGGSVPTTVGVTVSVHVPRARITGWAGGPGARDDGKGSGGLGGTLVGGRGEASLDMSVHVVARRATGRSWPSRTPRATALRPT
jgi:hypothetical protein